MSSIVFLNVSMHKIQREIGRHPCVGMKFAKLEIKMIVAMVVLGYEYDVVNSKGGIAESLPLLDDENWQKVHISMGWIVQC